MFHISDQSLKHLWSVEPLLAMYSFDDKYDWSLNIHNDSSSVLLDRILDAIPKVKSDHLTYILERTAALSTKLPRVTEFFEKFENLFIISEILRYRSMTYCYDKFIVKYITVTNNKH
jgi:hypothetical protein